MATFVSVRNVLGHPIDFRQQTKSNSGRGGSGNIRVKSKSSSKMAAIISEHEALVRYSERELIIASVTKRHEMAVRVHLSVAPVGKLNTL
jgi:hypothetical protein